MVRKQQEKPMSAPAPQSKIIVPRSEAYQRIEEHINKGRELSARTINSNDEMKKASAEGDKWRDRAILLLQTLFDPPTIVDKYQEETEQKFFIGGDISYLKERDLFKNRMDNWWIKKLESIVETLDLIQEAASGNHLTPTSMIDPRKEALAKIELITQRFHTVARQLKERHNDRETLVIKDEYDVQDLFHALLRLFFDDIRDEEWTPSYAGGATRIDFLLKAEQIVIELKMTRASLKKKDISDQLIIDSDRYQVHPDCKMLVAFVYDPQEYLTNPRGIERDLTKAINGVPVKIIISQR